ncbi:MAG: AtpZ/AtpI family protein [Phycisphaerae bacterium]|nr:AtpZ/AtpI family protein [Phycisphaerae bacterium]
MQQPPLQDKRIGLWTAGVEFAVTIILSTAGGYWLDGRMNTVPLWTLAGLALGFAAALWRLIRQVRPKADETDHEAKDENSP